MTQSQLASLRSIRTWFAVITILFSCLPALAKGGSHSAPHAAVKNGSLLPPDFAPVLSSRLGRDDTSYHADKSGDLGMILSLPGVDYVFVRSQSA